MTVKKYTAALLALLMLLVPFSASAEEISNPDFLLEIQSVNTELVAGDTVRVDVTASANKGYAYASAEIKWDNEALELTDVEFTDAAPNNKSSQLKNNGDYTVRFGSNRAEQNYTETGKFFTLVFKIKNTAEAGSYDISVAELNVFDVSDNALDSYSIAGIVNLYAYTDAGFALAAEKVSANLSDGEVRLPVKATKNDGYKTSSIFTSWDSSVFTLNRIEYTDAAPDNNSAQGESLGSYLVKIGSDTASSNFTATGTFFTLVFTINSDAKGGTYPVTLAAAFTNNKDGDKVKTDLTSGKVTIIDDDEVYIDTHTRPTENPIEGENPVDDPDNYGTVGDCGWSFDPETSTLTISGSGAMANYGDASAVPYSKFSDAIEKVVVSKGVTEIGDFCFAGLSALKEVSLPSGLERIGSFAFENSGAAEIIIPPSVTEIGEYAVGFDTNGTDESGDPIHEKNSAVTIKAESGSAAEAYASENGVAFTAAPFVEPGGCSHDMVEEIVRPDISKNTAGYQKVYCSKCGEVLANVTLPAPKITLSKTKYTYTGSVLKPSVVFNLDGKKIPAKDSSGHVFYTVKYLNNKNAGTASVKVTMVDKTVATGEKTLKFTIAKAANPMTAKAVVKTVKLKDVKKKNVTVKKAITVKKAQGAVSYAVVKKGTSKGLSISKSGVITIKKASAKKKATLKIVVNVTAKGNANYNKLTKKVTVQIKVK